jgi:hypothetical protein
MLLEDARAGANTRQRGLQPRFHVCVRHRRRDYVHVCMMVTVACWQQLCEGARAEVVCVRTDLQSRDTVVTVFGKFAVLVGRSNLNWVTAQTAAAR